MDISSLRGKFVGDVIDEDPKEPKFDREMTVKLSHKHRGNVRLSGGLFYTREEWEVRRKKLLEAKLP